MAIDDASIGEASSIDENRTICTVLCGRSFVGKSLVSMLLKSDLWIVRIADSAPSLILDQNEKNSILSDAVSTGRASYFQVDVREKSQICNAIKGSVVVFHMDASDSSVHDFYHHYMVTVQGTKNVINACRACEVKRLIYNSSADVVFDGVRSIHNGDESLPYPWRYEDMLSDLRSQAEALILFTSGSGELLTCALRPSNVFGPGDEHFLPYLIGEANSGRAKFFAGNGESCCDFTYVDNVAHAHICAEKSLCSGLDSVAGKAFFITNLEPVKIAEFVSLLLEELGYPRPQIHLPTRLVLLIAVLLELVRKKFSPHINVHRWLTPSMVHFLSCTRTFNCSNAQKQIGYSPIVSLEEGITLTIQSFSHLARDSQYLKYCDGYQPSKVAKLLGGGKVADLLLWRDDKKTFSCLLSLVFLFCWFFLAGRTIISSMARLLMLVSIILFGHGILPLTMFGFTVQKISSSYFQVSETVLKDALVSLASTWNKGVICTLRRLAKGDDWSFFFKVAASLYFLKLLVSGSFPMLIGVGLVLVFTVFIVYEQCEEEINRLMIACDVGFKKSKEFLNRNLPPFLTALVSNKQTLDQAERSSENHQ